jgi:HEAT repeat protein
VTVDESLRKAASQLARKEGSAWKIDDAARAKLDELGPEATEKLVPLLGDSSADARRGAAYYLLGRFDANNDALVNGFINLINDEDRTTRGIALAAIPKFKPAQRKAAAPQLAKLLETTIDDDQQRATAVRLLGEIGPEAASLLPQLAGAAANDKSPKVRSAALLAISHIASPADAVPIFQKALSDQEPTVRTMALQRLRALGRDAAPAVDDLAKLLEEKDEKTRTTAAEALVRIGSKSIPALEAKLESSSATTREVAVYALGKMGGVAAPALPALKKRLDDSDPKVKKLAEAVVAHIESLQ